MEATLKETLDAALANVNKKLDGYLRDPSGARIGVFRWLPATEEEAAPIGGARIDAIAIEQMAASLNSRATAIPIDGGPTPTEVKDGLASAVHGTASTGGGTPANGWAHAAVVHVGDDGVTELYLYAELFPSIAREVDAGRLAFGSVHFGFNEKDGDAPRDVTLISHALTNDPAVTTLSPANDVRTPSVAFLTSRTRSLHMATKPPKSVARRMKLSDSEEAIASLMPDVKPDDLGTEVLKIVASHCEKKDDAAPPPDMAASADAPVDAAKSANAARADAPPPPDAPAEGADAAAALAVMRDLIGKPDASLAECIDLLKANADPIKKAISSGPDMAAQADANQAAQASAEGAAADVARSRDSGEIVRLRTELEASRAKEWRSTVRSEVDAVMRTTGRLLGDDAIASLVEDAADLKDAKRRASRISDAITARGALTGDVMGKGGKMSDASASAPLTPKAATDLFMAEALKSAKPDEARQITRARAQRLAKAAHPAAFGVAPSSDI